MALCDIDPPVMAPCAMEPDIEPDIEPLAFGPDIEPDMEPLELDCASAGAAANRTRAATAANFLIVFSFRSRVASGVMCQYRAVRAPRGRGYSPPSNSSIPFVAAIFPIAAAAAGNGRE